MRKGGRPQRVLSHEEYTKFCAIKFEAGAHKCFSSKQMINLLSTIGPGCWKEQTFLSELVETQCLKRVKKGLYRFDQPVSQDMLVKAYDMFSKRRGSYRKASSTEKKTVVKTVTPKPDPIQQAIDLLKKNGFTIIKREFDIEKALNNPKSAVEQFIKETVY